MPKKDKIKEVVVVKKEVKPASKKKKANHRNRRSEDPQSRSTKLSSTVSYLETRDSEQAVQQMLNADACYVSNAHSGGTPGLVGSVWSDRIASVNFAVATRLQITTDSAGLGRVLIYPSPASHMVVYGAFSSGTPTSASIYAATGQSSWSTAFEQVAFTGATVQVRKLTAAQTTGGLVILTNFQGGTNPLSVNNTTILAWDSYHWPPNAGEFGRMSMISNNFSADFGYQSPTNGGGGPDINQCAIWIEFVGPASQTYEIASFACLAGIPTSSIWNISGSSVYSPAKPDSANPDRVRVLLNAEMTRLPLFSTAYAVARDDSINPVSWAMNTWDAGRQGVESFIDMVGSGKTPTERLTSAWDVARSFGNVFTNVMSLFGSEERIARILYSMDPQLRKELFRLVSSWKAVPTSEELASTIERGIESRRRGRTLSTVEECFVPVTGEAVNPLSAYRRAN